MVTLEYINNISEEERLPIKDINKLFTTKANPGEGNCLFYSLAQLLFADRSKSVEIRQAICDFNKTFNFGGTYRKDSLEEKLQIAYTSETSHKKKVCDNLEWGIYQDIITASIIYRYNIIVFSLFNNKGKIPTEYQIIPIKSDDNTRTIHLKLNTITPGAEHYEALIPKIGVDDDMHRLTDTMSKKLHISTPIPISKIKSKTDHYDDDAMLALAIKMSERDMFDKSSRVKDGKYSIDSDDLATAIQNSLREPVKDSKSLMDTEDLATAIANSLHGPGEDGKSLIGQTIIKEFGGFKNNGQIISYDFKKLLYTVKFSAELNQGEDIYKEYKLVTIKRHLLKGGKKNKTKNNKNNKNKKNKTKNNKNNKNNKNKTKNNKNNKNNKTKNNKNNKNKKNTIKKL